MRILSEKLVEVTSVATPLTSPEASRVGAGKASSLTSVTSILEIKVFSFSFRFSRSLSGRKLPMTTAEAMRCRVELRQGPTTPH